MPPGLVLKSTGANPVHRPNSRRSYLLNAPPRNHDMCLASTFHTHNTYRRLTVRATWRDTRQHPWHRVQHSSSQHALRKLPVPQAATPAASHSPATNSQQAQAPEPCDALIVGAGPAGLGTALLLAQRPEWRRIVVLEKRASIDVEDSEKSYVYMIDGRGRSLTDAAGVTAAMEAAGVLSTNLRIAKVTPDLTYTEQGFAMKDSTRLTVLLPRRSFLASLLSGLDAAQNDGRVRLLTSMQVTEIQLAQGGTPRSGGGEPPGPPHQPIVVHARDTATGQDIRFAPRLLVGADGMRSEVRRALEAWAPGAGRAAEDFAPVVLDSPAAGLRYKVLSLPPNPRFRLKGEQREVHKTRGAADAAGEATHGGGGGGAEPAGVLQNSRMAAITGVEAPRQRVMRLGLLPYADPSAPRTANIIQPPDHHVWTLTTGRELGDFLQESFPQLDIRSLLSEKQLDAAAASRGGVFPRPQYLRHFTAVLPDPALRRRTDIHHQQQGQQRASPQPAVAGGDDSSAAGGVANNTAVAVGSAACGVALVGDAVHCFPPDLAQGVNSALLDVMGLVRALDESDGELGRALPLYEARRAPEAAALAELMTFGGPYQYNQSVLGRTLWGLNLLLRMALNKLAPWAFSPQTFMLIQQTDLSYAQILQRVHETTRRIWVLVGLMAAVLGALVVKAAISLTASGAAAAVS